MVTPLSHYQHPYWHVHYVARTASTNDWALQAGETVDGEGHVFMADEQTAGRGRLSRRWVAPPGTCLLMSLLFRPPAPFAQRAGRLPMVCGLAMLDAIAAFASLPVQLKWPNDLIVTDAGGWRKLAGMLSEIGLHDNTPAFVVVGMGLNVNVPPAALSALSPNATSLLAETGQCIERVALLDTFLTQLTAWYARLRAGEDVWTPWRARLAWLGCAVQVQTPTHLVRGVAEDVDESGALLLRLPDGRQQRFPVGDVSLRHVA